MAAAQDLTWKVTIDPAQAIAGFRGVSSAANSSQKAIGAGELTLSQQLKASESLQRQRSAALIAEWKKQETAARNAAAGVVPFHQSIGTLSGVVQELSSHLNVFVGERLPLLGGAFVRVTENLHGLTDETAAAEHGLSSLSAVAGGAALGIAALIAIGYEAGKALFELAQKSAEFGEDIFKAHEKTALSVETLSALKAAGHDVGVELDTMTTGLVRFTNNLEAAAAGNKKLANEFEQLGVTAFQDNDKALQQFLAHFATLRTDQERTSAASAVFGARFGANMIEVFNHVGGDMEKFKDKLRELGLLMNDESVQAAHEFTTSLNELKMELGAVGRVIGQETMPAFEAGFKAIEAALEADRLDWKAWGEFLAKTILSVEALLGGLATVAARADWTNLIPIFGAAKVLKDLKEGITTSADELTKTYNDLVNPRQSDVAADIVPGFLKPRRFNVPDESRVKTAKAKLGSDPAVTEERIAALGLKATLDQLREEDRLTAESLRHRGIMFEEYAAKTTEIEATRHLKVIAGLLAEGEAAEKLRNPQQRKIQLLEIENKTTEENNRHKAAGDKLDDERLKIQQQIDDFIKQQTVDIAETITTTDKWTKAVDDFVAALQKEGVELDPAIERTLRFNAAMQASKERVDAAVEALKSLAAQLPGPKGVIPKTTEDEIARRAGAGADAIAGLPPKGPIDQSRGAVDQLFDAINSNLTGNQQTAALAGLQALTGGFEGLARGVGQAVEAWVLYGKAGQSVRQVTAQILASVAQQAAVKAIFELAEGFAALALAFFGLPNAGPSASAHFTAAAIYGSIAGIAALSGRAVAGNAFQSASGTNSAGNRTGGGAGGGSGGSSAPASQDTNRVSYQPVINVTVVGQATEGFRYMVEKVAVESVRLNGPMRKIQNGEEV